MRSALLPFFAASTLPGPRRRSRELRVAEKCILVNRETFVPLPATMTMPNLYSIKTVRL